MTKRWFGVTGMVCGLALLVSACGSSGGAGQAKGAAAIPRSQLESGGTLTELIPSDPGNLNPLKTANSTTREIDFVMYDPLVNELPDGKIVSGLATSWKRSGLTYTFALRHGVTCSDGSTLTAKTVAANFDYIANPKNGSALLGVYVPADTKATAHGAQVTLKLAAPAPFLLQSLANVGLVCAKGLAHPSMLAQGGDGTGPYVLSSSVPGQQYTLKVRHGYRWGPQGATTAVAGIPAKLVVKVVASPTTEANLLLQGQANLASVVGLANKPLTAAGLFQRSGVEPLGELWFDQATGHPEASAGVRRALTEALNLSQISSVFGQGEGEPSTGLVTVSPKPCTGNTTAGNVPSYDPAGAKKLLDGAGWTMGPGGVRTKGGRKLSITVYYPTDEGGDANSAFQLAAQQWAKVGVKVTLKPDTSVAEENVLLGTSGAWDVADLPLGIDAPNQAVPFLSGPSEPKGENFSDIRNPTYDSLTARAAKMPGSSGCPAWNKAEEALFKAADIIPFENESAPFFAKSATFSMAAGNIFGTSLRLQKG